MARLLAFSLVLLFGALAFMLVAKVFQVCWNVAAHALFHGPQIGLRPAAAVLVLLAIVGACFRSRGR